jgi:hypothetical protein
MAPYALTPTTERGEIFNDSQCLPQNSDSFGTSARETEGVGGNNANNTNSHNGHGEEHIADNGTFAETWGGEDTTNPAPIQYEDAYTDGYKEGYTEGYKSSHIELKHKPIAIIGMSCRFPGSVSTPDEFWEMLARSRTGFSPIPESRFSANRFFHPNPGKSGTTNARGGNFLTHDLAAFDAPFFGFTQQEALSLDPQQRLLLECTFEALETAGIPKHGVVGKDVGVFVGGTFSEYEADSFRDPETIPMHQATGKSSRETHLYSYFQPSWTLTTTRLRNGHAIEPDLTFLRFQRPKFYSGHGVFLESCCNAHGLPKFTDRRVKYGDSSWCASEHVTRILDLILYVSIVWGSRQVFCI